jgi:enoyl-CoA hydratase/carnithine racemase
VSDKALLFDVEGNVARIILNRQQAMNALNLEIVKCFNQALDEVERNGDLRTLLITGNGKAFCAGADLKEARGREAAPGEPDFLALAGALMNRLRYFPQPVIAALIGLTMAGGLELAMCADVIIAAASAEIGDAHANFGVYPGAGGAAILPRLIPLNAALYLLLTGRRLPAQRFYELGMIAEVYPDEQLAAAAMKLAADIGAKSPGALRRMKVVARASADKTSADALLHEQVMLREHVNSADFHEGLRAFAEKRPPRFTGR